METIEEIGERVVAHYAAPYGRFQEHQDGTWSFYFKYDGLDWHAYGKTRTEAVGGLRDQASNYTEGTMSETMTEAKTLADDDNRAFDIREDAIAELKKEERAHAAARERKREEWLQEITIRIRNATMPHQAAAILRAACEEWEHI